MMAVRWLASLFKMGSSSTKQYTIYRDFCKAASCEQKIKENPYFDKYANKIMEKQKLSPEDFEELLKKKVSPSVSQPTLNDEGKNSITNKAPCFKGQKTLNQIMKLENLVDKSAIEIETIWKEYHQSKNGIYAVLPKEAYEKMYCKLQKYPTFLFPVPKSQGYEFIMHQFVDHNCYFTSLINYQAYKENAPVCLTISYFTELMQDKGIVLMRGEFDDNALKVQEVQCLANQLQLYYGGNDEKREQLLWTFNKDPQSFRYMDLIANFEYMLSK